MPHTSDMKKKYLLPHNPEERISMLGKEEMSRIAHAVNDMTSGEGSTEIKIDSWWRGAIPWGRNIIGAAEDSRGDELYIARKVNGIVVSKITNQLSMSSLQETVRFLETLLPVKDNRGDYAEMTLPPRLLEMPTTAIWSDKTVGISVRERARIGESLISKFRKNKIMSSGFLEWRSLETMSFRFGESHEERDQEQSNAESSSEHKEEDQLIVEPSSNYVRHTQAQCSLTAFTPDGERTGWAGISSFDWSAIDCDLLANRAIEKYRLATESGNLEPGEYTAILEPEAVALLMSYLIGSVDRTSAERGGSAYSYSQDNQLRLWRTRIGMKMLDERITISHDPSDPMLGVLPQRGLSPAVWFEKGRLVSLAYDQSYARARLGEDTANLHRPSYRIDGGPTSMKEMIESTEHGVIINRLSSNIIVLSPQQLIMTGYTRNNMLEVKDGKISRSIRDMRFTDSPLLAFNLVEAIGPAVPVFAPAKDFLSPVIVPAIKVKRFALTSSTRPL